MKACRPCGGTASPLAAPPWKYRSPSLHTSDRHSSVSGTNPDGCIPAIPHQPKPFAYNIIELDAASNNSVDEIRSLIDKVRVPPQLGRYKVFIIDEVHMLSTAAFNAFLKTLEEQVRKRRCAEEMRRMPFSPKSGRVLVNIRCRCFGFFKQSFFIFNNSV